MVFQEVQFNSDKFLNKISLNKCMFNLNIPLAPNSNTCTVMSDNTICSVQNLAHSSIIAFCIMICLECNYSVE